MPAAVTNWEVWGPRIVAWLKAELPQRRTMNRVYEEAAAAFPESRCNRGSLRQYLLKLPEWATLRASLGSGQPAGASVGPARQPTRPPQEAQMPKRSLDEFLRDKKKAECPVCHLPPEIRAQLQHASEHNSAKLVEQCEWLRAECGVDILPSQLTAHRSGGHER